MQVIKTYTAEMHYRNGDVYSISGLVIEDFRRLAIKHTTTKERPVNIKIYPTPPQEDADEIVAMLKCRLYPGVPKGQVIYGN